MLRKAIGVKPRYASAMSNLGVTLQAMGKARTYRENLVDEITQWRHVVLYSFLPNSRRRSAHVPLGISLPLTVVRDFAHALDLMSVWHLSTPVI